MEGERGRWRREGERLGGHGRSKSSVSDQNGASPLYIMLEIHHSGRESSKYKRVEADSHIYLSPL